MGWFLGTEPEIVKALAEGSAVEQNKETPVPKKRIRKPVATPQAGWSVTLIVPCRVKSEANQRCHWAERRKRFKEQEDALRLVMSAAWLADWIPDLPLRITWMHVGRRFDSDNLAGAFKGLRDCLATLFDVDDGDERITWEYQQRAGKSGVEVTIEPRKE